MSRPRQPCVEDLTVHTRTIPTDRPESDGTLSWDETTIVVVQARAGDTTGLGYTYGPAAVADLVTEKLTPVVCGRPALDVPAAWEAMRVAVRNAGGVGPMAMALSAVDIALWDLSARLLDLPLCTLLGQRHDTVPIYGSGGFCSLTDEELSAQLGGWARQGIPRVKMKLGREPERDPHRLAVARETIGPDVELFVDANGAFDPAAAVRHAQTYAAYDVRWFEEPVSSDDRAGLRWVRDHRPPGMAVAAGEYAYDLFAVRDLMGCVDVQQADVTRCGGITVLQQVGALCAAHGVPLSAHCAPAVSAHAFAAVPTLAHLEYFHDHVRVESLVFDGVLEPDGGVLRPDRSTPGHGLSLREGSR